MGKITIPEGDLFRAYIEQQGVDNLSAISFFQFHHFSHRQRDYAGQEYRKLVAMIVRHHPTKGHSLLWGFKAQKQKIAEYWKDKLEQEKQKDHASSVKDQGRIQSLAAVNAVTRDTLKIFDMEGAVSDAQKESTPTTDTPVAAETKRNLLKKKRKAEDTCHDTIRLVERINSASPEESLSKLEQDSEASTDDGASSTNTGKEFVLSSSSSAASTKTSSSTFSPMVSPTNKSSASAKQRKKAPLVSPCHAETEDTLGSEGQRTMVSSSVSPPPARDSRKKKAATVMDEPWKKLTVNLHQLVNAHPVDNFATADSSMPHLHEQLFHHAIDLLSEYRDQEQANKDKSLVKDAQVAMSCVLNTMSPRAVQHFIDNGDNEVITRAVTCAAISTFEQHSCLAILPRYLKTLQEHNVHYVAWQLIQDRNELRNPFNIGSPLSDTLQKHDKVLEILQYLCQVVSNPPFAKDPSENDVLLIWSHVFGLARSTDCITLQSGERMLEVSKVLRQQQASEFGDISDAGRKVDLAFLHKDIELSNIEFKRPGIGAMDITVQCRKNIRLGRCLQEQQRCFGVQEPSVVMGDIAGFVGVFYQLTKMGEVWVAGTTSPSTVHLPITEGEFEIFLESSSLAQIFNFVEHLELEVPRIKRRQERFSRSKDTLCRQ